MPQLCINIIGAFASIFVEFVYVFVFQTPRKFALSEPPLGCMRRINHADHLYKIVHPSHLGFCINILHTNGARVQLT